MCAYNNQLVIDGGQTTDLYCELSLPKGYRFKGYKMVLLNNINGKEILGATHGNNSSYTKIMYETASDYNTTNYLARGYYADSPTTYIMGGQASDNSNTREYVVERMSLTSDDMGNNLYFRLAHEGQTYFGVTIKSFTVYFTAEGTFEAEAKPASREPARSLVFSPFSTSKMDIGSLKSETSGGKTYFAYTYTNVKDIQANTYIYQDDAIQDGTPVDVAPTKKIYPVTIGGTNYFAFGNGVYYAEAPTLVYGQTGLSYPIGYRVVGAKFTPQWGAETPGGSEVRNYYYITYTPGSTTYYLNDQLRFTTERFGWYYDESTGAIYTGSGVNIRYLSCEGDDDYSRSLSFSTNPPSSNSSNPGYYDLIVYTRGGRTYIGWNSNSSYNRWYLTGTTNANTVPTVVRGNNSNAAAWVGAGQQTVTFPTYKPGAYTLKVYDKTGATVVATKTVNSSADAGTAIDLSDKATYGYNNDAIKFEITGLPEGCTALVDVSLFMQALNPYIDQMSIRCHDAAHQLSLSQPFTAENFRVAGKAFDFYIPYEYRNADLTFTFEDLWSQYGDNTYYTGALQKDGYARYSFVTSPYFETVDQNGDNGLYNNPNYSPDAPYGNKVIAEKAGNIRYKFNNAENLKNDAVVEEGKLSYLEEYPFTVARYIGSEDPDGGSETGALEACTLNAQTATSDTYYLFTADETRYNIAPSSAWQHRYYAFYRMDINLTTHTYDPKLDWTKVYDETCFVKDGSEAHDAMWGLKLGTVDHDTQATMTGYLTVKEIDDAITTALTASGDNHPTSFDQILYVDGSDLYSIISSGDLSLADLKAKLAPNALFYLPANTTSTLDNFAYKPSGWETGDAYRAGKDIVLTDKAPFYAPYDIQVDTDNKAIHERQISKDSYGKVQNASLIMPFQLKVEEGKHTNTDGTYFTLHKMQESQAIELQGEKPYAYFPSELASVTLTAPHTPYLVNLEKSQNSTTDGVSFVVSQTGTLVKATTSATAASNGYKYFFTGESSQGTVAEGGTYTGGTYAMTNQGTYAGQAIDKTKGVFYFARNRFVNSAELASSISTVKIYPFRSYYKVGEGNAVNSFSTMNVIFGENENTLEDAIRDLQEKQMDMSVRAGRGTLTITSATDNQVRINSVSGVSHYNLNLGAGETKTVSVPAGIYVVNGVKILVK